MKSFYSSASTRRVKSFYSSANTRRVKSFYSSASTRRVKSFDSSASTRRVKSFYSSASTRRVKSFDGSASTQRLKSFYSTDFSNPTRSPATCVVHQLPCLRQLPGAFRLSQQTQVKSFNRTMNPRVRFTLQQCMHAGYQPTQSQSSPVFRKLPSVCQHNIATH